MKIYLIMEGAYATANNDRAAKALETVGFKRCTKEEYQAMVKKCRDNS
jgi:hypothetical protein